MSGPAKRLYRVSIEVDVMVLATDEDDATDTAERYAGEEIGNGLADVYVTAIRKPSDVGPLWGPTLPWGGDGETTCSGYAARTPEEP